MADADSVGMAREIIFMNYSQLIGITFLYWDHLITLGIRDSSIGCILRNSLTDAEINLIWRGRKALSAYCFFVNRYFAFTSRIALTVLAFLPLSTKICIRYTLFREAIVALTQVIVSVVMVIRVYAIYGRSRRVLAIILGVGLCTLGSTLWSMNGQQGTRPIIFGGCNFSIEESTAYRLAGSWEALFVFDSVIFAFTVYNAITTRRRRIFPQMSLHTLVIRDGAMYFGIVALVNLANIATYYFEGPLLPGSLAAFANCISVTMISRLILNLHKQANVGILTEPTEHVVRDIIPLSNLDDRVMTEADGGAQYRTYSIGALIIRG
ncbi:hypothetical protein FB451DRAFT_1391008 [Mycena latifolia]|nr:hypothetical protein FB451DRAFT_1391008 [Mycena latifolia]